MYGSYNEGDTAGVYIAFPVDGETTQHADVYRRWVHPVVLVLQRTTSQIGILLLRRGHAKNAQQGGLHTPSRRLKQEIFSRGNCTATHSCYS